MNKKKILVILIFITAIILSLIILFNPIKKYKSLTISKEKWNNIISSRTENDFLRLVAINFNDYNVIVDEKNDLLYYSLINDSKEKYNPIIRYISNMDNSEIAILEDEITDEKVKSNYKFKIIIYNNKEYHIYNLICTDFPILNISYKMDVGARQKNIPMKMYLFNNLSIGGNRVTLSDGKIKLIENGYVFLLEFLTPGKNIRENIISILNMKPSSEYILKATELNNSEEKNNNRVAFFINGEYQGIYNIMPKGERTKSI